MATSGGTSSSGSCGTSGGTSLPPHVCLAAGLLSATQHLHHGGRRSHVAQATGKDGSGSNDRGSGKSGSGGGGGGAKRSGGGGGSGSSKGKGSADDKADPNKADFSAYWSLRFREFFSGRRQYLELSRKRQEPPELVQKLDAQIADQQKRLEDATQAKRDASREAYELKVLKEASTLLELITPEELEAARREGRTPPSALDRLEADVDAARAHLQSPRVKVAAITALQLRAAARTLVLLPLTLPAALLQRWQALFADRRYESFLLAEGERVWYWRNRMENERWFWEVFFMDRFFIPVAFMLGYLYLVPNNLIWAVVVPFVVLFWQDGRLPSPRNLEWWLIMVFGLYGKCREQVAGLLSLVLQWW